MSKVCGAWPSVEQTSGLPVIRASGPELQANQPHGAGGRAHEQTEGPQPCSRSKCLSYLPLTVDLAKGNLFMRRAGNHLNLQDDGTILGILRPAQDTHANEACGVVKEFRNGLVSLVYPGPHLFDPVGR